MTGKATLPFRGAESERKECIFGDEAESETEGTNRRESFFHPSPGGCMFLAAFQPLLLPLEICSWLHQTACSLQSSLHRAVLGTVGLCGSVV